MRRLSNVMAPNKRRKQLVDNGDDESSKVMAPNKRREQLVDNGDDESYLIGVQKALDYAFGITEELYEMRCPCVKCCYTTIGTRETIESHLKVYGIIQNYTLGVAGNDSPGAIGNGQGREQGVRSMCSLGVSGNDSPGAIGNGQGREQGVRSLCSLGVSRNEVGSFHQNSLYSGQSMPTPCNSTSSDATISDYSGQSMPSNSNGTSSDPTISVGQGMQRTNRNPLVQEKEQMQIDIQSPPSTDQVMQYTQTVETSLCTTGKVRKGRGRNKCKEVASLQAGQKLKVTFYNNRTVGKNSSIFSRHLGKLVRDQSMCPLGVSSWDDIEEEKLNNMWAAVEDKFESDDMDIHRDHILGWMKELWNKWRGQLHGKFVKGKPIQEALKNKPTGVDKKQWKWLVKEHFSTETFQARSNRNSANRAKLKMFHRIGSKPIREVIYQKGGKNGNPPDLATIFFETRKKDNKLVESEAIEKHAQIQELVQSEPSLPSIEIVEKCFGPQIRSHVFGFGGGVKAKDLKGAPSSKAELLSELRSTREENQSLMDLLSAIETEKDLTCGASSKAELVSELHSTREENKSLMDRLSAVENEMKELKQLKELFLARYSNIQPPTLPISGE